MPSCKVSAAGTAGNLWVPSRGRPSPPPPPRSPACRGAHQDLHFGRVKEGADSTLWAAECVGGE